MEYQVLIITASIFLQLIFLFFKKTIVKLIPLTLEIIVLLSLIFLVFIKSIPNETRFGLFMLSIMVLRGMAPLVAGWSIYGVVRLISKIRGKDR